MMDRVHYLTPDGLQKVQDELESLSTERRTAIAERLAAAIQQGDISENADYEVAKQDQGFNEGRIKDLQAILRRAKIIGDNLPTGEIQVGSQVTVTEDGTLPEVFNIVGPTEASPANGRISHESPVGAALLGRKVGETVQIETPAGSLELTIVAIE